MNDDQLSKLERLSNLLQQGAISKAEFESQKSIILQESTRVQQPRIIIQDAPKSKMGGCMGVIAAIMVIIVVAIGVNSFLDSQTPKDKKQIRREYVESLFSAYDGSHAQLEKAIKSEMKNPDSYEHVETRFRDDSTTIYVITTFRGTNSFGGIVPQKAEATLNGNNGRIIEWRMLK